MRRLLGGAVGLLGAAVLAAAMALPAFAQSYPSEPIRFIVPFPPGGGTDFTARIVAPKLSERLGQPVVVENRPGGGSHVGSAFLAKARPDGYTIGLITCDVAPGPALYKSLGYDPVNDFAPISMVAENPLVLIVRTGFPANNLKEFVEYARAHPGKVNYGSSGMGGLGHLAGEMLKSLEKLDMVHAAYKGAGPAMVAFLGGEIDMTVVSAASAMPHIKAGKARLFAALGPKRIAAFADAPTSKEAGVNNYEAIYWNGLVAPKGTPSEVVNRIRAEWLKIAQLPDVREAIGKGGLETVSSTPQEFAARVKADVEQWTRVVKDAKIPHLD
jgi:tripartite-type tricarboxylate transporter receptor subunit TctC